MEKYSQYRDRSTGISPFLPHSTPLSTFSIMFHTLVFLFRLPLFLAYSAFYFLVLTHLPLPAVARKLLLWGMLGILGIWWVDLQLDGVKRGSLHTQPPERVPHPGSVIAATFTSPIDALYLSATFDPVFTVSYPGTSKVQRISLLGAILRALGAVELGPSNKTKLTTLRAMIAANPGRVIAVFPECSTTNGKGILPFSPSLLSAPKDAPIFPISLRYTPQDICTPVPGAYLSFFWNLLSRPTHCIRVRIAEGVTKTGGSPKINGLVSGANGSSGETSGAGDREGEAPTPEEQRTLDRIGENLARLARNKRVGLTLRDKAAFVDAWNKRRR